MNTKYKSIIAVLSIILVVVIAGGWYMHHKKEEQEAFWTKQKSRIELFYQYNYIGVHSFTYTDMHKLPTGTYVIEGYVNDDPQLNFNASADPNTNFEGEGGESAELSEMVKPEYASQTKSVSQILKEKNKTHP
ncbi:MULTISPECIES: DUF1433 domain-containing protein [Listeria]|uniref:DUF1433 domain-containing protein n=1 Tax=Listeria TaxID=1637 RepID=UPI000B58CF57|nr:MULTISPECIES: DUF1433 domain-containing protein [Listeria]